MAAFRIQGPSKAAGPFHLDIHSCLMDEGMTTIRILDEQPDRIVTWGQPTPQKPFSAKQFAEKLEIGRAMRKNPKPDG
jgi:hypothetical protein